MAKEAAGAKKKIAPKKKDSINSCEHLNGPCPCTNLNGAGCKDRQNDGRCLKKAT
ncbi:MAG: hypothetical protein U0469_02330 [Candidatus Paceibacterota bacterium]|jgi:hypothetical protein